MGPWTLAYHVFGVEPFLLLSIDDPQKTMECLHKLKEISRKLGVIFFSTPGDLKSLKRLVKIGLPIIKISSGLMTNFPLIGEALKRRLPVIISTGLSDNRDLENLDNFLQKFKSKKVALLKCTSQYPANDENLDLKSIIYLEKNYFSFGKGLSRRFRSSAVFIKEQNKLSLHLQRWTQNHLPRWCSLNSHVRESMHSLLSRGKPVENFNA